MHSCGSIGTNNYYLLSPHPFQGHFILNENVPNGQISCREIENTAWFWYWTADASVYSSYRTSGQLYIKVINGMV